MWYARFGLWCVQTVFIIMSFFSCPIYIAPLCSPSTFWPVWGTIIMVDWFDWYLQHVVTSHTLTVISQFVLHAVALTHVLLTTNSLSVLALTHAHLPLDLTAHSLTHTFPPPLSLPLSAHSYTPHWLGLQNTILKSPPHVDGMAKSERVIRCVAVGDSTVGKTSVLLLSYSQNTFNDYLCQTVWMTHADINAHTHTRDLGHRF